MFTKGPVVSKDDDAWKLIRFLYFSAFWLIVLPLGIPFFLFFCVFFSLIVVFKIIVWCSEAVSRISNIFK